jgi:hypothetical protein
MLTVFQCLLGIIVFHIFIECECNMSYSVITTTTLDLTPHQR